MAYQTRDVLEVMVKDSGFPVTTLRVDGGAIRNQFLAQFQADIVGCRVDRPRVTETTALGAAFLAGLAVGFWPDLSTIQQTWQKDASFEPQMDPATREARYQRWQAAVDRARGWVGHE